MIQDGGRRYKDFWKKRFQKASSQGVSPSYRSFVENKNQIAPAQKLKSGGCVKKRTSGLPPRMARKDM